MKQILCLLFCLFSIFVSSKTIIVQLPAQNSDIRINLQAAIDKCVNFDTVKIGEGFFTQTGTVTVTKFINIVGAGKDKTIIYRSESTSDASLYNIPMILYNINKDINYKFFVADLTLKSKKPSLVNGDGLSLAVDMGIKFIKSNGFHVTRCRFENFGNGAVSIVHGDSIVKGIIYKNEFVHNAKGYDALGLGYGVVVYGENKKWIKNPRFGSVNFIFVEDNVFDYHRHSIAAGGCGLYVFRYNVVRNNVAGNTAHAIDAHEARLDGGVNNYSTRAIEVYGNIIINTTFRDGTANCPNSTLIIPGKAAGWLVECAIRPRGGEAVIHDNYIEGYRFGVGPIVVPMGYSYPVPYQVGYQDADLYAWNDVYRSYSITNPQCIYFYNYSPVYLKNEKDYFLRKKDKYNAYTYPNPIRDDN